LNKRRIFLAEDIVGHTAWMYNAVEMLTDNVFITIDLDGLDPSIMPSTGTPEPGGLLWYDVINFLKKVIKNKNVVGFDVVELAPNEHNRAPDFLASKLIYKLLSYKFH
jgi:agmatinase